MHRRRALHSLLVGATTLTAASLLLGCKPEKMSFEGVDITGAAYGKDFPLFDTQGKQRSVQEFAGKVVVVFLVTPNALMCVPPHCKNWWR
jgi:Uncharacterized protein SCO1/SenC/PrrC, involved in biogenesis of respiratory and photosynthetic systems